MSDWRPFEPSRDAIEEMKRAAKDNTCNMHRDCAAADAAVRRAGGRYLRTAFGDRTEKVMTAVHCHDADCEDCFGC